MSTADTRLGRAAWVVTLLSLLLGPLAAAAGIVLALASRRGGGDWQPTVALAAMVLMASIAAGTAALAMA